MLIRFLNRTWKKSVVLSFFKKYVSSVLIASSKMSPPSNNPPLLQSTLVFPNRMSDKPLLSMLVATESASKYADKLSLLTSAPESAYELSSRVMAPSAASA